MAGFPQYPPPPVGMDARTQRRMLRDQAKLFAQQQKAAASLRRTQLREQARALRVTSVVGPLLLIGVGVAVLVLKLYASSRAAFWSLYGRWWPLLLVAAGVVMLLEWAWDQRQALPGAPTARRTLGGGTVLLLILVAAGGVLASGVSEGIDTLRAFSITPDNVGELLGEKHASEQRLDEDFPAGSAFAVDNPHGDVVVEGTSTDGQVHVAVDRSVYGFSDDDAARKADEAAVRIERDGSTVRLVVPSVAGAVSNLAIRLPASAAVTVTAGRGDLRVSGVRAPVSVTSNRGDVEVRDITGNVDAHLNSRANSFTAHGVQGDVAIAGHGDNMTLTDVQGKVRLAGEFYGDTHVERVAGPFEFNTTRTQLALAALPGSLDMSSASDLAVHDTAGPLRLRTRSRNITFDGVRGDVSIVNSDGPVEVLHAAPGTAIAVETTNGEVRVGVPERPGLEIAAETRDGHIRNDFGLTSRNEGSRDTLNGRVGDGAARIDLRTTHADIAVERNAVPVAAAPVPGPGKSAEAVAHPHGAATRSLTPAPSQP